MRKQEDEFKDNTRRLLAGRVGWRCNNPMCKILTCGPTEEKSKVVDIGEASHICAAAPGEKRFDPKMSSEERSSFDNGIWLWWNCYGSGNILQKKLLRQRYEYCQMMIWLATIKIFKSL